MACHSTRRVLRRFLSFLILPTRTLEELIQVEHPPRNLVIHYVAYDAPTLAGNERFHQLLLDSNGEMGSDLVAKLL